MTFALIQRDPDRLRIIGTLWADDELRAQALVPAVLTRPWARICSSSGPRIAKSPLRSRGGNSAVSLRVG